MIDAFNIRSRGYPWWVVFLQGALAFILGICFFVFTRGATLLLFELVGLYFVVTGVLALASVLSHKTSGSWAVAAGVVGLIGGVVLMFAPFINAIRLTATLFIILALIGIVFGIMQFVAGIRHSWNVSMIVTGVITIIFSVALFMVTPLLVVALPYVLGLCGIFGGILLMVLAIQVRSEEMMSMRHAARE